MRFLSPLLVMLLTLGSAAHAAQNNDVNEIFQYLVPGPKDANAGAYLWIPPNTPVIRAVMVGIHNGLPMPIMEHPAVRQVCRDNGIAQVLMTPNGSDIGAMLKDLNFDVTDPAKTEIFDRYLGALADLSGHPELKVAPLVPLAHSAYASFPFEVALRDPARCLMAIPIKAGFPYVYKFYGPEGKATKPNPDLTMTNVPILCCTSMAQVTAPGSWKSKALPFASGSSMGPVTYRADQDSNPGDTYQKGNELLGYNWEMLTCHFDMSQREYTFIAKYLAAISRARLPATPPAPGQRTTLINLTLSSGWLVDPLYSNAGKTDQKYAEPAPYGKYTGTKSKAWWYPTEALAREMRDRMVSESAKKFEMFTVKDLQGQPIHLLDSPQVDLSNGQAYVHDEGLFTLGLHTYRQPFPVCTSQVKDHQKNPEGHRLENILFPGLTELPVSTRPLLVDANAAPVEVVTASDEAVTFRLRPHRLAPEPGGYNHFYVRIAKEADDQFATSSRDVKLTWWLNGQKTPGLKEQKITFPTIADLSNSTKSIKLDATSSAGLPVGYFVQKGPAVVVGNEVVITEVPVGMTKPIAITIGAYQTGLWKEGGVKAAPTAYQTFALRP